MKHYDIDIESPLTGVGQATVWQHVTSWDRVNDELWPFNMTHPAAFPSVQDVPADGKVHFVSKLRLGFVPVDLHRLSIRDRVDGEYFDERSSNLLLREWLHHRSLRVQDNAVIVRDQCRLTPRFRLLGGIMARLYRWIFRRRHARLRAAFADAAN